jgi:hypothetical protein
LGALRRRMLLTNNFPRLVCLTVNSAIDLEDNVAPIFSVLIRSRGFSNYQIQRG